MDGSSPKVVAEVADDPETETQMAKRRKIIQQKNVVTVKIDADSGKLKSECPPSDPWSWRKYGQKPIKGSPYPRGYYRCSTSKGCSAKKQVERSRTDGSMFIITYTSDHNHPQPDVPNQTNQKPQQTRNVFSEQPTEAPIEEPDKEQKLHIAAIDEEENEDDGLHYLNSSECSPHDNAIEEQEQDLYTNPPLMEPEKPNDRTSVVLDEHPPVVVSQLTNSSPPKSEENDFFDELEELSTLPSFSSFMRSFGCLPHERIPVAPS